MVGSSGGKMIVNSEKRPCGVVVGLPIPMEGKGGHSNFQFHHTRLESLEYLIVVTFLYHFGILSIIIIIFGH